MNIKWSIKKEILDGVRNYRILILFMGLLLFAVLDPVMNKMILPQILKSQFPGMPAETMNSMVNSSQAGNIRAYLDHAFQMGILITVFTLCGTTAQEINQKTLILPLCAGKRYGDLILSKLLVYGTVLIIASVLSTMVCYAYSGILFGFQLYSPLPALRAGLFVGMYLVFVLSLLIMIGVFVRKPIAAGVLTLIPAYGMGSIGGLLQIDRYLPSGLLTEGRLLAVIPSGAVVESVICTLAVCILAIGFTVIRLGKMELSRG